MDLTPLERLVEEVEAAEKASGVINSGLEYFNSVVRAFLLVPAARACLARLKEKAEDGVSAPAPAKRRVVKFTETGEVRLPKNGEATRTLGMFVIAGHDWASIGLNEKHEIYRVEETEEDETQ